MSILKMASGGGVAHMMINCGLTLAFRAAKILGRFWHYLALIWRNCGRTKFATVLLPDLYWSGKNLRLVAILSRSGPIYLYSLKLICV